MNTQNQDTYWENYTKYLIIKPQKATDSEKNLKK